MSELAPDKLSAGS